MLSPNLYDNFSHQNTACRLAVAVATKGGRRLRGRRCMPASWGSHGAPHAHYLLAYLPCNVVLALILFYTYLDPLGMLTTRTSLL